MNIHKSFWTFLTKTNANLLSIATTLLTSIPLLQRWIDTFGLKCLIDLFNMRLPSSMSWTALRCCMTSPTSMSNVALGFYWRYFPVTNNFQPQLACSGTLQTMITFENSNMAFLILHGHKVTTRIPWINDFRLEPEAKLELAQQTFPSWKISR